MNTKLGSVNQQFDKRCVLSQSPFCNVSLIVGFPFKLETGQMVIQYRYRNQTTIAYKLLNAVYSISFAGITFLFTVQTDGRTCGPCEFHIVINFSAGISSTRPLFCSSPLVNMVVALGSIQPVFTLPPIDEIPDDVEDKPAPGDALVCTRSAA